MESLLHIDLLFVHSFEILSRILAAFLQVQLTPVRRDVRQEARCSFVGDS